MSVYTVAVTLAIIVPSLNLINYNPDLYFVLFSAALLFINTTVLCLVFLPKVGKFVDVIEAIWKMFLNNLIRFVDNN